MTKSTSFEFQVEDNCSEKIVSYCFEDGRISLISLSANCRPFPKDTTREARGIAARMATIATGAREATKGKGRAGEGEEEN